VTNSKNSFELTAFFGGTVSTQDVFSWEFELWGGKLLGFVKWKVWLFFGLF